MRALFKRPAVEAKAETETKSITAESLSRLPKVTQMTILSYVTKADGMNKHYSQFFKKDLLAERIVRADLKAVKAILKNTMTYAPDTLRSLLVTKKIVKSDSGLPSTGAPLQLALGAQDPEMIDTIQEALRTLPEGEELINAQRAEQFPGDWEEAEKKTWAPILSAMKDVFTELERSPNEAVTCDAKEKKFTIHCPELKTTLETFRGLLAKKMQECVTTGRHFNPALWLDAFREYDDEAAWEKRGGWNSTRNNLAWCQIIGFIQCFLPAVDKMATAQGIYYIVEDHESLKRSFKFRHEPDVSIYPGLEKDGWVLGENFAVCERRACVATGSCAGAMLENLYRSKTASLQALHPHRQPESKTEPSRHSLM